MSSSPSRRRNQLHVAIGAYCCSGAGELGHISSGSLIMTERWSACQSRIMVLVQNISTPACWLAKLSESSRLHHRGHYQQKFRLRSYVSSDRVVLLRIKNTKSIPAKNCIQHLSMLMLLHVWGGNSALDVRIETNGNVKYLRAVYAHTGCPVGLFLLLASRSQGKMLRLYAHRSRQGTSVLHCTTSQRCGEHGDFLIRQLSCLVRSLSSSAV